MADDQNDPSLAMPKRPRPLGFHAKVKPPRDLHLMISSPYGFRTASTADDNSSSTPKFPRSSHLVSLNIPRPWKPTLLSKPKVISPSSLPIRAKIAARKSRSPRHLSQINSRKSLKAIRANISGPATSPNHDAPPVPSLPTFLISSRVPHYPSLLETAPSLEALRFDIACQTFGLARCNTEDIGLESCKLGSEKHAVSSSSTIKLDAFTSQIDKFPSLIRSATMVQELEQQRGLLETSLTTEQLQVMSFGSVKPRGDWRSSIATCATVQEARMDTPSQSSNADCEVGDLSLLLDDSPSFLAMTKSNTSAFPASMQSDYAENKHQRLLAAILESIPPANGPTLSTTVLTNDAKPIAASVPSAEVPEIVVTRPEDDESEMLRTSSSFSIIDLYTTGRMENRSSVLSIGQGLNKDQSTVLPLRVLGRRSIRNSISFPEASNTFKVPGRTSQATHRRADHRRSSFLSPGIPSSFLSMSAISETGGNDVKRHSVYGSGLKGLFRRSSSKGSLMLNGAVNSGNVNENLARRTTPAPSVSRTDEGLGGSRLSGWGIFRWMKG